MASTVLRTTCLFVLASPCLADPPQSEQPELRKQITSWIHERDNFSFTGTVEFELVRRSAPEADRAAQVPAFADDNFGQSIDAEQEAENRDELAFQREFLEEWAARGVEVIQGWRIIARESHDIRAEVSFGYVRPETRSPREPHLAVVASRSGRAWEWNNNTGQVIHDGMPSVHRVDTTLVGQARSELMDIFTSSRAWLLRGRLSSVDRRGDRIVAEFVAGPDTGRGGWQADLEFEPNERGLLLRRAFVRRDSRYFEESLADYRPVDGLMVAHHRVYQYGPIEDADRSDREPEEFNEYVVRSIDRAAPDQIEGLFDLPKRARAQTIEQETYTYEEITGPGRSPFMIKHPR